jgi:hypothetical protein
VFREARQEVKGPVQIAPPELESLGAGVGYVARFAGAMARLTVDGLRQGRDGLRGDVRVEVGPYGEGVYRTLTEGRLELPSLSQREAWERRLRRRGPGTDWDAVLDAFCAAVLRAEKRLDKPAVLLRDVPRPAAAGMLLEPYLMAGMPTLWYGDGGTLKSLVGLAACLSLETGVAIIGRSEPAERRRVLFCNFEPFDDWEHRERMRQLLKFRADDPSDVMPSLAYLDCCGGTILNQTERIRRAAKQFLSEFLVIDSISCAADGPLNDDETARLYYRALGYIGLPSLSTGHTPKNGNVDSPFGSVLWKNLSRLGWYFQRSEGNDGSDVALKLTCKKWSTVGRPSDVGLLVRFGLDTIDIERGDAGRMVGAQEEQWRRIQSRLRLENMPMTYEEIALTLALEPAQVKARVNEHKDVFVVLPPKEGTRKARVALRARQEEQ